MPIDVDARVIANERLTPHYNVIALEAPAIAIDAAPGQFVMVRPQRGFDPLLRRPFSIFEILKEDQRVIGFSLLNKRVGVGTGLLFEAEPGDRVQCLGPLGRPYVSVAPPSVAWMVAGGVGLAPFAMLAETLKSRGVDTTLFYGGRTSTDLLYLSFFESLGCRLMLATEDGTRGVQGRITKPLEQALRTARRRDPGHDLCVWPGSHAGRRIQAGRDLEPAGAGVGGTGHGLRARRLLQLRHPNPPRFPQSLRAGLPVRAGLSGRRDRLGANGRRFKQMSIDLSVKIGQLVLHNPVIAASGCFGYGTEYADVVDLSTLGGVAVKGLFLAEREGHPPPRIVETPAGMLNAIGLQGIGVRRFIAEKLPELRARRAVVIVNICGTTVDEYVELSRILSDEEGVAAIELNISCPNIKEGGISFGCSLPGTHQVVSAVRRVTTLPIIPKLTPNVTDVAAFARASEEAGADAVSLVNTFLAMAIDVETRRPKLSNIVGGLSGPAIRPIAVRMVYECHQAVRIPIIGMGGIASAADALEFMIAGATAVQVGTANFVDPGIWPKLIAGIEQYLERQGLTRIGDLIGTVDTRAREQEWISS